MDQAQIQQVLRHMPKGRTTFRYFKDRYALMLLSYAAAGGRSIRDLRRSQFANLLEKPVVKRLLSKAPGGVVRPELFDSFEPAEAQSYRLTLGTWAADEAEEDWEPCYDQTSRPGANLVLQLNFTREHNRPYYALLKPRGDHPFLFDGHPIAKGLLTLAWARIDASFDTSEVVIEEVQNDWIRRAQALAEAVEGEPTEAEVDRALAEYELDPGISAYHVRCYVEAIMRPYAQTWAEATLAAAIWYIVEHLRLRRIYFNTFEGGSWLKELEDDDRPPRSVYSTLPKRFGFKRTREPPLALTRCGHAGVRKKLEKEGLEWFVMEI